MSETQSKPNPDLQQHNCDDKANENGSQTSHTLNEVSIPEKASQEDMSTIGDINYMPHASKSIGQSHNENASTYDGNQTKNTKTNDLEIQESNELNEVSIREGASEEDKNTISDINNMPQRYDGNKQNADESASSTDDGNPNRNANTNDIGTHTSNELKAIPTIGGASQERLMPINKMLMRVLLQLIIFNTKLPVMGMKTSANKDLDEQQIARNTRWSSGPAHHDAKAEKAVLTHRKNRNGKAEAELEVHEVVKRDEHCQVGRIEDDVDKSYAEMEKRLLESFEKRWSSVEQSMQQTRNFLWILSFLCVIAIGCAMFALTFTRSGDKLPLPDSRLNEVENQLRLIQGNYVNSKTLKDEVGVFKNEMRLMKEDWKSDIETQINNFETIKKEIEGFNRTVKTIDNTVTNNDNTVRNLEQKVRSTNGDVQSILNSFKLLKEDLELFKIKIEHVKDNMNVTIEHVLKEIALSEDRLRQIENATEEGNDRIKQLNAAREQLELAMNNTKRILSDTTGTLNRTNEMQKLIHENTFHKGAVTTVIIIIFIAVAAIGFYVCVYRPWQPRKFSQANTSEAQQALNAVPPRPILGSTVCIISFNSNRSAGYQTLVRSALSTSGCTDTMHDITKHSDISRLPHCKIYIMCVEFSERHVIIEEPGLALGDMKRTTYEAVEKLGGVLVILYVNHRGSSRIQNLYSTEIYCVNRQPQLKTLETRNRFISTYDQLNDHQKDALKQALRDALN